MSKAAAAKQVPSVEGEIVEPPAEEGEPDAGGGGGGGGGEEVDAGARVEEVDAGARVEEVDAGARRPAEEGAEKKFADMLTELGGLGEVSAKLLEQLTKLKESTRTIDYTAAFENIIKLSNEGDDEVNIYLLKKMAAADLKNEEISGNNPYYCIDIVGLLQRLSINKLLQLIDKRKIPNSAEIGNISIFSLLLRFINTSEINNVIGNNKYQFKTANDPESDLVPDDKNKYGHFFGGVKRKKSSKKSSLKTHSINNLRWLVHIGLRSLQQINSGKKPVSRKSSTKKPVTKKPAVATKDDLLKVAKKLKLSGLSSKTKKDIAAAIRKVDVKKLNESQKKTLEKFKNMKM